MDLDESVGQSLKEELDKEYGPDKTLFLPCNVETESQLKGMGHVIRPIHYSPALFFPHRRPEQLKRK